MNEYILKLVITVFTANMNEIVVISSEENYLFALKYLLMVGDKVDISFTNVENGKNTIFSSLFQERT